MRTQELKMLCHESWLETRRGVRLGADGRAGLLMWSVLRFPDAMRAGSAICRCTTIRTPL